ncbi:WS/DGAT/MGAT family O-acyltransferase [Nocardia veterana]|uniref:Diacylglycerol O-acyltransferase n=1 Tax=Nocardia veterana TaxID=132249 RepID=A0A7X6M099_9NOCA|nr:wax ester/triacylglycerol synthase family O-acyltransferase [Nocardia veterana]NKY87843.1 wax ester/triacylglycerol synthase family O-acyltransferase [Nocardia veterana]
MTTTHSTVLDRAGTTVRIRTPGEVFTTPAPTAPASTLIPHAPDSGPPRQLSHLDLHLLDSETATAPLHIGAVMLLDSAGAAGGPLAVTTLRRLFAARLHLIAPLRRRVRAVPLGLDEPYWEDCDTVDLGYHVRAARLPDGASDADLADYVARRHAQLLDRSRPLWECHLVSGLSGGRQAVYTKIHHAVIDGVSAAEVMAAILDVSETPTDTPPPATGVRRDRTPSLVEMVARSSGNAMARQSARARAVRHAVPALLHHRDEFRAKHPDVPFNGPLSASRSVAYTSLPLDAVKAVKRSIDGTVNDVVMALCTSALRSWMLDRELPATRPLLAAIPVSVRTPEQFGSAGNQFSLMLSRLPIDESDPRARLTMLHHNLVLAKERFRQQPPTLLHELTALLTPALHGLPTRALLRAAAPTLPLVNLIVSNVPGPQFPLYLDGIRVLASYPVSVLTELSGGLNITVMSYDGHLDFGILGCPDAVPDIGELTTHLGAALAELHP